jgi:hypothetical protein
LRTDRPTTWISPIALVVVIACTFELPGPPGDMGTGGGDATSGAGAQGTGAQATSQAGTGGGVVDPCEGAGGLPDGSACAPAAPPAACTSDLPPSIAVTGATLAYGLERPSIVFSGDRHLVFWGGHAVLDALGEKLSGPFPEVTSPRDTAQTSGATFAFASDVTAGIEIHRVDRCGQPIDSVVTSPRQPGRTRLLGGDGGYVLTQIHGNYGRLATAWLADGSPAFTAPSEFPGEGLEGVLCCTGMWAVGRHQGALYAAWVGNVPDASDAHAVHVGRVGGCGAVDAVYELTTTPTSLLEFAVFVGTVKEELVVALTHSVHRAGADLHLIDSAQLQESDPYSTCAYASSGAALGRACRDGSVIRLDEIDPTTGAASSRTLAVQAAGSQPGLAYDGHAWAVVWMENAGLAFSRLCPASSP